MAQLNKSPLGKVQGSLGDMAFRQKKGGTNVIAMRPKKPYTPPQDQASIDRRSRFKFSAKLAQSIISVPELAAVWQPVTPAGMSTFNYIIQKNDPLVGPGSVAAATAIVPATGFAINSTQSITFVADGSTAPSIALTALGNATGIDITAEPNAKIVYVLSLTGPSSSFLPGFIFIAGASAAQATVLDTPMTFSIPVVGSNAVNLASYGNRTILFALVTLDSQNNPVKYSGTLQRILQAQD